MPAARFLGHSPQAELGVGQQTPRTVEVPELFCANCNNPTTPQAHHAPPNVLSFLVFLGWIVGFSTSGPSMSSTCFTDSLVSSAMPEMSAAQNAARDRDPTFRYSGCVAVVDLSCQLPSMPFLECLQDYASFQLDRDSPFCCPTHISAKRGVGPRNQCHGQFAE